MLATPPPHPHEIPQANPNPLATAPVPPTTGTKITPVIISRCTAPPSFNRMSNPSAESLRGSADGEGRDSDSGINIGGRKRVMSTFGGGCVDSPAEKMKQKKPKNSIGKTGSSFVSRIVAHQNLSQRLQERKTDGLYLFANINRALLWMDMSSPNKVCFTLVCVWTIILTRIVARTIVKDSIHESASTVS
jgi:catabolite repression protein CreC